MFRVMTGTKRYFLFILLSVPLLASAQNYHAIQGSSLAGGLGVHNNPSSIVNNPFKWDLTLIGIQAKASTNIVTIRNYSLLSKPSNSEYIFEGGLKSRYAIASVNVNLLNARIALNRKHAIAFGANLRNYIWARSSEYNFFDTLQQVSQFLTLNERNQPLGADAINSSWIELYGTYAVTVLDNEVSRLNAGATLKLSRGISGAHAGIGNARFNRIPTAIPPNYDIGNASASYGYSSNYDRWVDENSTAQNIRNFLQYTEGGISIDAGIEWLVRPQAAPLFGEDDYFDYEWKLGLSLLDFGVNQYKYGTQSRTASGVRTGITSVDINNKFDSTINSLQIFNDSLATVANQFSSLGGVFRVINPTRLVANVDRYVQDNFFINAELSVNLSGIFGKKWFYVKEMNLLTVTPRWETRRLGVYMPVSFNTQKQFWVGAAVKAGPVLFGLHNLAYIFSKKSIHKGGGYLAITLRPFNFTGRKRDRTLDCPPETR